MGENICLHSMLYKMALVISKLCFKRIRPHAYPKLCQWAVFNATLMWCHLISTKQLCFLEHEINIAALLKSALNKYLIQLWLELVTENFFMVHLWLTRIANKLLPSWHGLEWHRCTQNIWALCQYRTDVKPVDFWGCRWWFKPLHFPCLNS